MVKIRNFIKILLKLNNTPREIARGVAIGVFIGVLPLYGLHTLIAVLIALFIPRTNKIAIVAGSNISIPPTAPFISWAGYEIGRVLLRKDYPDLHWMDLKNFSYKGMTDILYPLFLGSFILGIISALAFYFLTLLILDSATENREING